MPREADVRKGADYDPPNARPPVRVNMPAKGAAATHKGPPEETPPRKNT